MQRNNPILTLAVAASLLNLHPRTLMLYEKEGLIKPHRTGTNRRLFSPADLATIQFIQYLTSNMGVNLKGAKVIMSLLEKAANKYPGLKRDLFSDFAEKDLL